MAEKPQRTMNVQKRIRKSLREHYKCSDIQLDSLLMQILGLDRTPTREDMIQNMDKILKH